ncbi:MAG: aldo/keto reductase [Proteobacteria bacterium]|nr:aldo/keto reductase [Pseudomonadota bacterium]MDA1332167.1 aldo/keto reductase [Pseudomonadota bacterium]
MKIRQLGMHGPHVSAIGVGAMSFSDFYGLAKDEDSHEILSTALDLDINHIDTSNVYGNGRSETVIGSFLKKQGKLKNRLFTIASKVGICRNKENGQRYFDNSEVHIRDQLEKSLGRLGVETLDLYYIHRRDETIPIEEVAGTMSQLIKEGKIKSYGFSEIAPSSLKLAHSVSHVAAVQSEYSLSTRNPELGLTQTTKALGTALVAFSPVGRSLLTDSPHTAERISGMDFLKENPRFIAPNLSRNIKATNAFRKLAGEFAISASGLAIAWLLHQGEHIIPIPGTRSVAHLKELAEGAQRNLTINELKLIEEALPVGWAHGSRYSVGQTVAVEQYC